MALIIDEFTIYSGPRGGATMPGEIAHRLLNGPMVDQVFADETAVGDILWYVFDHQNTVRDVAVFDGTPGDQAEVVNHLTYDSFGNVVDADDPTTGTASDGDLPGTTGQHAPQRSYTGREPDVSTGLIYYRARWYDPQLGRFISEDPIGFAAGDTNLSRYVGNSTPNATDPSGLFSDKHIRSFKNTLSPEMQKELDALINVLGDRSPQFHHTYQQAIRDWAKSRGIDVDAGEHIRLVDRELHGVISREQSRFWRTMGKKFGTSTIEQTIARAEYLGQSDFLWERMEDFNASIEKNFGDLWLKPGFTTEDVADLKRTLCIEETLPFQSVYGSKARTEIGRQVKTRGFQLWQDIADGFEVDGVVRKGWRWIKGIELDKVLDRVQRVFQLVAITFLLSELNQIAGANDPDLPLLLSDYQSALEQLEGTRGEVSGDTLSRITERVSTIQERLQLSEYHRLIWETIMTLEEGRVR